MKSIKIFCLMIVIFSIQFFAYSYKSDNNSTINHSKGEYQEKSDINTPNSLGSYSKISSEKNNKINSINHPLTRDETVLMGYDEFGVMPIYTTGSIYDDNHNNFSPMITGMDTITDNYQFTMGDFDGDGNEEILVADGSLPTCVVYMIDYENGSISLAWNRTITLNILGWFAITAADLDADGVDEFAMLLSGTADLGDYLWNWVYFWAYDIQEDIELEYKEIYSVIIEKADEMPYIEYQKGYQRNWLDIESGDFDSDGADEVAFVLAVWFPLYHTSDMEWYYAPLLCQMLVLDDSRSSFTTIGNRTDFPLDFTAQFDTYIAPQLEVGDFDNDGVEELALMVLQNVQFMFLTHNYPIIWIFNYIDSTLFIDQGLEVELNEASIIDSGVIYPRTFLALDTDGDFQHELAIFGVNRYGASLGFIFDHNESHSDQTSAYYSSKSFSSENASFIHIGNILDPLLNVYSSVGDVDCDGKDEIILSDAYATMVLDDTDTDFSLLFYNDLVKGPTFCGNIDGDGLRVKYTGNFTELAAPPGITAVLAAPPSQYGIDQNYISSYTGYGEEVSVDKTEGNYIGHKSSTSVSFEVDIGFGVSWLGFEGLEIGWTKTWAKEHLKTEFETKIESRSEVYATGSDHDCVVYHITTYRRYEYEIIDHPTNSSLNGGLMKLNIPLSSTIHHESVPYFNNLFSDLQIGNETLNHTIGEPWTYPSLTDLGVIAPTSWRSGTETVGQGSGWILVKIDVTTQTGTTMTKTITSDFANKNSAFGIGGGRTSECISGSLYEIIVGDSCIFEGVVGDIANPDVYDAIKYDFGLYASHITHPSGCSYLVVNYWVENAVEYDPSSITSSTLTTSTSNLSSFIGMDLLILFSCLLYIVRKKKIVNKKFD